MSNSRWLLASLLCASSSVARAHISVNDGGTHMSRDADSDLKDAPCGRAGSTRGTNVYTYKPGETINITIVESVPHPGYFRIAFDDDGDDDFETPSGSEGTDGNCGGDPNCGPGKADYCNNSTVLLDNLDQHAAGLGGEYTWSVTLPNVECANCTLQIIQVMNDMGIHFAPYPQDDIYYHCIDLVLSNSAADVNDTPVTNDGMVCNQGGGGGMGGAGGAGGSGGGAATSAGGGGMGGAGGVGGATAGTDGGAAGANPTGGTGGSPGVAGTMGLAGMSAGGVGGMPPVMPPVGGGAGSSAPTGSASKKDEGGCRAAGGDAALNLAALTLAMLALGARRRRGHAGRRG